MSRYDAGREDEFEPGSEGRVLRNQLGIVDPRRAELVETELLRRAYRDTLGRVRPTLVIDEASVVGMHRDWLREIYPFAGRFRTLNVSKDGFLFAPVPYLPQGMAELDALFRRTMLCIGMDDAELSRAIAETHAELILLHPFREGNGRLGRLMADVMAVQAGRGPLLWSLETHTERNRYYAALRRGFVNDYEPLSRLVRELLPSPFSEDPPP